MIVVDVNTEVLNIESLCRNSINLIRYAGGLIVQHINIIEIMTYHTLGKWIIEVLQEGNDRAYSGDRVIDRLSEALTEEFGRGYSREEMMISKKERLDFSDTGFNKTAVFARVSDVSGCVFKRHGIK